MEADVQVAVVGAGPAGARAAELLAALGLEVTLFDPRAPWEKPCGGGLTAAAVRSAPELLELLPLARRVDQARLEAGDAAVDVALARPLHVVSRTELGRWQLARARAAGAVLERMAVRRVTPGNEHDWLLELDGQRRVRARLLVGADGAASVVRRAVAGQLRIELTPTRVARVPGVRQPFTIGLRFYHGAPGYAWDFPRADHRSLGCAMQPRSWSRRRMDSELDRYRGPVAAVEAAHIERTGAVIGAAGCRLGPRYALLGGPSHALLGDAAGLADPATGEGIQNALRSAEFLAEAYALDASFQPYPEITAARLEPEFALARRLRWLLFRAGLGYTLVHAAERHRTAHALLTAALNGENEHNPALAWRWLEIWRRAHSPAAFRATSPGFASPKRAGPCRKSRARLP